MTSKIRELPEKEFRDLISICSSYKECMEYFGMKPNNLRVLKERISELNITVDHFIIERKKQAIANNLKFCTKCRKTKKLMDFVSKNTSRDGLSGKCRKCLQKYYKDMYKKDGSAQRASVSRRKKENRKKIREYILDFLLSHPCVDCGEKDPLKLTFDHVRGVKRYNISALASGSTSYVTFLEEIHKCVSRCAGCHNRKTAIDRNFWMVDALKKKNIPV